MESKSARTSLISFTISQLQRSPSSIDRTAVMLNRVAVVNVVQNVGDQFLFTEEERASGANNLLSFRMPPAWRAEQAVVTDESIDVGYG
jgi:CMP-2-keto-3-deoxyoctulosonic acid synthetase